MPSIEDWVIKLSQLAEMDNLTKKLRGEMTNDIVAAWSKFKVYLEKI